jgi:hypothetical protein
VSEEKREVPWWVVLIVGAAVGLAWGMASEYFDLTFWHALSIALALFAVGQVRVWRRRKQETQ